MAQNIIGVNNHQSGSKNTIEDYSSLATGTYRSEGIIRGLRVKTTDPDSSNIQIEAGDLAINVNNTQGDKILVFSLLDDITTLSVPNTGTLKYYLVVFKIDITNATQEFEVLEGDASNDPTLTEGGSPEVYYLPIARISTDGDGIIAESEIEQGYDFFTNPSTGGIQRVSPHAQIVTDSYASRIPKVYNTVARYTGISDGRIRLGFTGLTDTSNLKKGTAFSFWVVSGFTVDRYSGYFIEDGTILAMDASVVCRAQKDSDESVLTGGSNVSIDYIEFYENGGERAHPGAIKFDTTITGISSIASEDRNTFFEIMNKIAFIIIDVEGSGSTGTNTYVINLPIAISSSIITSGLAGYVVDNGNTLGAFCWSDAGGTLNVRKYNSANYNGGTAIVRVQNTYKI